MATGLDLFFFYPSAFILLPVTLLYTFNVDSGQNVLERGGMKQVTHFLLRLRFKHITRQGHFNSKNTTYFCFMGNLTEHAGGNKMMLILKRTCPLLPAEYSTYIVSKSIKQTEI